MKNDDELIPTRESLLSRLKDREDHESWAVFFDTYAKLIYGAAVKAGLRDAEAQDAVQETVISVMRSMPDFKYEAVCGSFKSWLLQLTTWRITDQFRKRLPTSDVKPNNRDTSTGTNVIERFPDLTSKTIEEIWNEEWENNLIEAAVKRVKLQVDAKQYQIFDLYTQKGWSVRKISQTMQVSAGQVYLAKHRISSLIKKEIRELRRKPILLPL